MHLDPCAQSDGRHGVTPGIRPTGPDQGSTTHTLHAYPGSKSRAFPSIPRDPHRSKTPSIMTIRPSSPAREGGEGDTGRTVAEGNKRDGPHPRRRGGPPACGTPRTWPGARPEGTPCVVARIRACDAVCARRGTRAGRVSSHASRPRDASAPPRPHGHTGVAAAGAGLLRLPREAPHPSPGWRGGKRFLTRD
jgi:hypothetical protein